jgi:HD-like signal output (HDOD) protein
MASGAETRVERGGSGLEIRIGNEIRNIGIPPRPRILDQIDAEMRKDEPDFRHLASVIGSDVGLAASVIKVSNSPYFGFDKKVRSVPEALLVLGLKVTIQTIAGIALQRTFPHVPSLERFWDSAANSARVSGWLAQRLGARAGVRPDDAYTFGLFRDSGIPVLMIPFPEYRDILKQANNEAVRLFTAVEDEALSINHALVGSELAKDWLLPRETAAAILHHHEIGAYGSELADRLPPAALKLIAITQLAEHLIQICSGLNRTMEWNKLGSACQRVLELHDEELTELESAASVVIRNRD